MFSWLWPWAFLLIPLPLLLRYLTPAADPAAGAIRVPFFDQLTRLGEDERGIRKDPLRWLAAIATTLAWVALVCSVARPMWVGDPVSMPISGRDLMLAVDISGSMREDDMKVSQGYATRIDAVKYVVGEFVERRKGDRLGLILFGEQSYLQTPLTFDRNTVRLQLNEALPGFAGNSTAIGDAIGLSISTLRDRPAISRVLILLTDGANTAGTDPRGAAKVAREAGIRIHTVGVGAERKVERTILGPRQTFPSRDLDEKTLTYIAETTGGIYFRARDPQSMAEIYAQIDKLEPVPEAKTYRPRKSLFHWPLALAGALMLLVIALRFATGSRRQRPVHSA